MNSSPAGTLGLETGMPDGLRRGRLTGGATSLERERPRGRSGWVTAASDSDRRRRAGPRGDGTANSGVPKKTTRIRRAAAGSGPTSFT